jgi:hypothetical protein
VCFIFTQRIFAWVRAQRVWVVGDGKCMLNARLWPRCLLPLPARICYFFSPLVPAPRLGWSNAPGSGAHQSVATITPSLHLALLRFAISLRPRPQQVCTSTSALCSLISRCWTTTFVVALHLAPESKSSLRTIPVTIKSKSQS